MRHPPRFLSVVAALVIGASAATAAPAASQSITTLDPRADLALTLVATPSHVKGGDLLTYTITVRNQRSGGRLRTVALPTQTATGIVVLFSPPVGASFESVSAERGFACTYAAGLLTCRDGILAADTAARITVAVRPAHAVRTITSTATVDPLNTVAERDDSNNAASTTVRVGLPDLTVSADHAVLTYSGFIPTSALRRTITVRNIGPFGADDVTVTIAQGGIPGIAAHSDAFACIHIGFSTWRCSGGSLAAGQTATITLTSAQFSFWTPTTDDGSTTARVDPDALIPESDEGNNQAVR